MLLLIGNRQIAGLGRERRGLADGHAAGDRTRRLGQGVVGRRPAGEGQPGQGDGGIGPYVGAVQCSGQVGQIDGHIIAAHNSVQGHVCDLHCVSAVISPVLCGQAGDGQRLGNGGKGDLIFRRIMVVISGLCCGNGHFTCASDSDLAGTVHSGGAAGGPCYTASGAQGKGIAVSDSAGGQAGDAGRSLAEEQEKSIREDKRRLEKAKKRLVDIDKLITRIYEDMVLGNLSQERYQKMQEGYEAEQAALNNEVIGLEDWVATREKMENNVDQFLALLEKCVDIPELTITIVNEFVKQIIVYAPDKSSSKRTQKVRIVFNFLEEVEVPEISEPVITETTYGRRKTA